MTEAAPLAGDGGVVVVTKDRPPRRRRRWFVAIVVLVVLLPVLALLAVTTGQDAYVFGAPSDAPDLALLPRAGLVTYRTADGVQLEGWFLPADEPASGDTALVFHGSHSTRAGMVGDAEALAAAGVSVLLTEYRGFGGLDGDPSEEGLRLDAEAAAAYLRTRPGVDPARIVYVGYSLGTGPAVDVAVTDPPAALVLLAPYTSLTELADVDFAPVPYGLLLRTRFDSESRIRDVHVPVLVVRGSVDPIVPPEMGRRVFDAANEPKELVMIEGADHGLDDPADGEEPDGPVDAHLIVDFLDRHRAG